MKQLLKYLFEYKTLNKELAREALLKITNGEANAAQIASFISVYLMRPITVAELEGFREVLLDLCVKPDLGTRDTIDLCGTGGDEKNTFNISTLSSFVVAASGVKVTKHGNYGVSSVSGSSNVMEYFGYKFSNDSAVLKKQLDICNICFLHAPLFHPALKTVGPVRKELGVKTFFNMLGPLVNPARPNYQSTGVFNLELARLYSYLLSKSGTHYVVIHSLDGYDEVSLTGAFKLMGKGFEKLAEPEFFGMKQLKEEELFGGNSVKESADIFLNVLSGKGTLAQNNAIIANSAVALHCYNGFKDIKADVAMATEALQSGKAYEVFKKLINQ